MVAAKGKLAEQIVEQCRKQIVAAPCCRHDLMLASSLGVRGAVAHVRNKAAEGL
jgi:hypothetical protein